MIEKKLLDNNFTISFNSNPSIHIREYYNYCLSLLIENPTPNINVIYGPHNDIFDNTNKTIRIDIQYEHTLVKDGGRGVTNKIVGSVLDNDGNNYLVRIDKFDYYNTLDMVIEYSNPNIKNIKDSNKFNEYVSKNKYIAPLIYEPSFDYFSKSETITMFTANSSERRDRFNALGLTTNIEGCYTHDDLYNKYKSSKIMVNVHQTDHHHTFEELRVLPALLNGVIIVSETVPLKEEIPYHEFIIWSDYDKLGEMVKKVQDNYEVYYNELFNYKLKDLLLRIKEENKFNIKYYAR